MIYPIVVFGNATLSKVAKEIDNTYPNLAQLCSDMFQTLDKASGVGLAAPQIGLSIRLFIVDLTPMAEDDPKFENYKRIFINPTLVEVSEAAGPYEEGCLSVPGLSERVIRPLAIKLNYFDENWVEHTEEFSGFEARVIQHEYDHLEGHVFVERISPIRKQLISGKLNSIKKGKFRCAYKAKN